MYDPSEGTEKSDHYRELALSGGLTVSRVRVKEVRY